MSTSLPARADVDPKYTWDAASIFATHEAWTAELEALKRDLPVLESFRGTLGTAKGLLGFLETTDALGLRLNKLNVYAGMFTSVDATDSAAIERRGRVAPLGAQLATLTAFAKPEMLELGLAGFEKLVLEDSRLDLYRQKFRELELERTHVRSAEVEAVLGGLNDPFGTARQIHGTLTNADLKFEAALDASGNPHEVANSTMPGLAQSPDRTLRLNAWKSYSDGHIQFRNTMAQALSAGVKQQVFMARSRGYASALEGALEPNFIPLEVFFNLIDTFKAQIPMWHRYWSVRKRLLGLEVLSEADVFAPLTAKQPELSYEQSCEWILEGMKPLGETYVETSRRGLLSDRWVDVLPNKGKRLGAYSTGGKGMHPYIFMSYNGLLGGLSTLAHELGHSMHTYLTCQTQPAAYTEYGLFVAEVASNFNQALVRAHLFKQNPDPDFQLAVLEEAFQNFHRYFFVMPTLARFELEIHQRVERGEALTADSLTDLCAELFREGYGPDVEFDRDRIGSTWMKFSTHLYSNFYVYMYATGISGAHALAKPILEGVPGKADAYLEFLKAGSSLYPLDALKLAGVDLSSPKPVQDTFAVLTEYVDRLEGILKARGG